MAHGHALTAALERRISRSISLNVDVDAMVVVVVAAGRGDGGFRVEVVVGVV